MQTTRDTRAAAAASVGVTDIVSRLCAISVSVQRLERTCAQLQAIVEEQEKAIKTMEKAIKSAGAAAATARSAVAAD